MDAMPFRKYPATDGEQRMDRRRFIACCGFAGAAWFGLARHHAVAPAYATNIADAAPAGFRALQRSIARLQPEVGHYRETGPFSVELHRGYVFPVSTQRTDADLAFSSFPDMQPPQPSGQTLAKDRIDADLFLARHADPAPLIVFMHGYGGSTVNHQSQARHVASWGMHAVALRLLNDSEWGTNGRTLARFVRFLQSPPKDLERRIDPSRIILIGYSFGAISTSVALALRAPVLGAVLLDPAAVRSAVANWLPLVQAPVMIIGADENVAHASLRDHYFQHLGGRVVEVSVAGATHEDAQSVEEEETTPSLQTTFNSMITAAAFSFVDNGRLDYAWRSIQSRIAAGELFGARRK